MCVPFTFDEGPKLIWIFFYAIFSLLYVLFIRMTNVSYNSLNAS
ncbi:unnamed protein product [Acanthoscelides obtectus]|uniref:Uncharacterized protein n=1 Tax=Acanthoscelides obtectus TaxID=200917 RepID=A0A9P0JHE2_ACAOB|nr:unnamed protein product [Acanthoscelides obtectus]CAK1661317.1 hypothetical protein AOBTE_LOCUS22568 [Acanthoscelides obtectus]